MQANKDKLAFDKKRKDTIIDLSMYLDRNVRVKFTGGREVSGILKGFDPLLNMVLDSCTEYLRDPEDIYRITDNTRELGLVVCKGPTVEVIFPADGVEPICNPFIDAC